MLSGADQSGCTSPGSFVCESSLKVRSSYQSSPVQSSPRAHARACVWVLLRVALFSLATERFSSRSCSEYSSSKFPVLFVCAVTER
jgi:hypothetical protein